MTVQSRGRMIEDGPLAGLYQCLDCLGVYHSDQEIRQHGCGSRPRERER